MKGTRLVHGALSSLLVLGMLALPARATEQQAPSPAPDAELTLGSETASISFIRHGLQSARRGSGFVLGGDLYIDTGYETNARELESEPDIEYWLQQGRFMLEASHTYNAEGGFFVKASAQFLAHVDEVRRNENIDTDDAWLQLGVWDCWDLQVGRYEGWEVYHKGQGLERDTLEDLGAWDGPDIYEVNYAFYRQDGVGQAALHVYPTQSLRFELGSVFGNELGFNYVGLRPAGIWDLDTVKLKVAAEWKKLANQEKGKLQEQESRGLGGSVQFFFDEPGTALPLQFGVNGAYGLVDKIDPFGKVDERGSVDTLSMGGFVNLGIARASIGLGYNHTVQGDRQRNDQTDEVGRFVHQQLFAALKHPFVVPEATAKVVFAYARATLDPAFDNRRENEMISVRLRVLYRF